MQVFLICVLPNGTEVWNGYAAAIPTPGAELKLFGCIDESDLEMQSFNVASVKAFELTHSRTTVRIVVIPAKK